jgi:FolB domain-containing protein
MRLHDRDKVFIKDLRLTGIIGIYERERTHPQEILINAVMQTDIRKAAKTDNISDCVDYEKVANRLREHATTVCRMTVEALAEDLAQICLAMPGVQAVTVRVEKTQAIPDTGSVGVEISRKKA